MEFLDETTFCRAGEELQTCVCSSVSDSGSICVSSCSNILCTGCSSKTRRAFSPLLHKSMLSIDPSHVAYSKERYDIHEFLPPIMAGTKSRIPFSELLRFAGGEAPPAPNSKQCESKSQAKIYPKVPRKNGRVRRILRSSVRLCVLIHVLVS
jgi:hypothetical protein